MGRDRIFKLAVILVGAAMLVWGLWTLIFENRGYTKTDAVITHIEEIWDGTDESGFDEYSYITTVSYQVNGKEYKNELCYYQDGYEEGKTIKIFYNPENPEDIHADTKGMGIYLVCAGLFVAAAGVFTLLRS